MINLVKTMAGGMTNQVHQNDKTVIKSYSKNSVIQGFGRGFLERMSTEILFLNQFSIVGVSPKIISCDLSTAKIVVEFFNGKPLGSLLAEEIDLESMFLTDQISNILQKIHKPVDEHSILLAEYKANFELYIKQSAAILNNENIDIQFLQRFSDYIYHKKNSEYLCLPSSIVHGDFWLNNILFDAELKQIKIIDWEHGTIGSPYLDLGTFYIYCLDYPKLLKTIKLYDTMVDQELIIYFGIYRILKLLSFINLEVYQESSSQEQYSFKHMVDILKKELLKLDFYVQ